jgi:hypothetical protein
LAVRGRIRGNAEIENLWGEFMKLKLMLLPQNMPWVEVWLIMGLCVVRENEGPAKQIPATFSATTTTSFVNSKRIFEFLHDVG